MGHSSGELIEGAHVPLKDKDLKVFARELKNLMVIEYCC
ncbi:hypothetical protein Pan97_01580 [Bremerella volcania]|uniref:Uncharacterized protein n=1 Tax=Bremerella volcania TaxID=2527984 RepID=A0A518C1T4_9BACT|nr:hypothetical protein Pan97_01580 [Bremerella volcania]